jgi:hypothetical protein
MNVLDYAGLHPPWRCGAFGDKGPEERAKISRTSYAPSACYMTRARCATPRFTRQSQSARRQSARGSTSRLHELLKGTTQVKTESEGKVNVIQGQEGWRNLDDTWMEEGEEEEEVHFVNIVQVEEMDSDEELVAEIARTEEAIDDRYRRRAKRVGIELGGLEGRPLSEEERDKLSERLRDWEGVRAKRRKEIEEMQLEAMEAEVGEVERTLARRRGTTGAGRLGHLSLVSDHYVLDGRADKHLHSLRLLQQE